MALPPAGRAGYVIFVDAARDPGFAVPASTRRTGPRRFAIGHLTAEGCALTWNGGYGWGQGPALGRLARLRRGGGRPVPVFGGPYGGEPASTCADPFRLLAAYRKVLRAFGADRIELQPGPPGDDPGVLRRAAAINALQAEARARGRLLAVTLAVPAGGSGVSHQDRRMLDVTQAAGAEITTVNLLVSVRPGVSGALDRVSAAFRAARRQFAEAPDGSRPGIALTLVPSGPGELSPAQAARLAGFAARHGLDWLSVRGGVPSHQVLGALGSSWTGPAGRS
jgi:hypothetical protein